MITRLLVVATALFACLAAAQMPPPMPFVADEFKGDGAVVMPFFGKVPTVFYFSYIKQRQRWDQTLFGTTQILLEVRPTPFHLFSRPEGPTSGSPLSL